MRFLDEFRDGELAQKLSHELQTLAEPGREVKIMEVCGGHTHSIYKHGIEQLVPEEVDFVHGPGCPVCVIPMGRVDDAIALAERPEVIFTTFGDMLRVPGGRGSLLEAKARGADVRMVYSPLDALELARRNPGREVVFFAIGFETTARRSHCCAPGTRACATSRPSATTLRSGRRCARSSTRRA
jgi:hydrogenase expression/formation protein HypD